MNKALIAVDVQNDFLPGGALGVPDGDQVIQPLIDQMENVDVIVLTRDWHPPDHISFSDNPQFVDKSWPVHCVGGTWGAVLSTPLVDAACITGKPVIVTKKGFVQDREEYSGFEGVVATVLNDDPVNADLVGETLAAALFHYSVNQVKIGGLALDYCVKETALASAALVRRPTVILHATRPVAYLTGALAVAELVNNGLRVI